MFKENLSLSLLQLCDARKLSYEAAAELCDLSPKYIGSIARRQTAPTILTLEKLCLAFESSPNELLRVPQTDSELSYRIAMPVTSILKLPLCGDGFTTFPICPRCNSTMEWEYQAFCDRCGQKLDWADFRHAKVILKR